MNVLAQTTSAHPQLDGIVEVFDLASEPVDLFLRGLNGSLEYEGLTFGTRYRVAETFEANRSGGLEQGARVWFLGAYVFPYDNGLRLYFDAKAGQKVVLEFEGNLPASEPQVNKIDRSNRDRYFQPIRFDISKRTKRLVAARAVIEHHRKGVQQ